MLTGATYDDTLSKKTSVVVSNSREPSAQKTKYATERRIPIVHVSWLWDCLRTHQLQPYGKHQLDTISSPRPQKPAPREGQQAFSETATAKLSTEESFELQKRKKAQAANKTAKPRGPARPGTLDLVLSADPSPVSTTGSSSLPNTAAQIPVQDEDTTSISNLDGQASLPLQNISANSPRRPSTTSLDLKPGSRQRSSSAESLIRPVARKNKSAKEPTPDSVIPEPDSVIPADSEPPAPPQQTPPEQKDYSTMLAQLRANRKSLPSDAEQSSIPRRRERRKLGRATSARSNDSANEGSAELNLHSDDDREIAQEYQPSQELGWDLPGAAKAREQMIRRLGGKVAEEGIRVEGIGIVRDAVSESVGGRAPRKRRERGF